MAQRAIAPVWLKAVLLLMLSTVAAWGLEVNEDGKALILEAQQTYRGDMENRPVVTDENVKGYVEGIVKRLVPAAKKAPTGVRLSTTILESPQPELFSYVDGHIVITTGMVYAMENEAQLAGILAREVANVVEGYYIALYQEIKAAERSERNRAAVGALFSGLLDVAVDYAAQYHTIELDEAYMEGTATYGETMKKMAAIDAATGAYYTIRDVAESTPERDSSGNPVDPRMRFDSVADAQGMEYSALAGYESAETAKGWANAYRIKSEILRKQEAELGMFAAQIRETQSLMNISRKRMVQALGSSGLLQSRSDLPPNRSEFVAKLVNLQEVKAAEKGKKPTKGVEPFRAFLQNTLLPSAEKSMQEEQYERAYEAYTALWNKGVHTAPVAYGIAKCKLGDFAFGASEAEKESAEAAYFDAIKLDKSYAPTYKGLAELYADWERYQEAADAYRNYLKYAPKAKDRGRVERKIKTLERKAAR